MKRLAIAFLVLARVYAQQANGTLNFQTTVAKGSQIIRNAQSKLRELPSVMDFGAKGTGATDDSPAFQLAANSIGSGSSGAVFCPAGTYLLNSNITVGGQFVLFVRDPACNLTGTGTLPWQQWNQGTGVAVSATNAPNIGSYRINNNVSALDNRTLIDATLPGYSIEENASTDLFSLTRRPVGSGANLTILSANANAFALGVPLGASTYTVATLPASSPAGEMIYVSDAMPGTVPCQGSGSGAFARSTGSQWNCTSEAGNLPGGSQTQYLQITPNTNGGSPTYRFISLPSISATDYSFPAQTPGGTLSTGVNTITMTPVPLGVNGTDVGHYLYVSSGTGTAESCLISGGSGTSGQTSGSIQITCANAHSGAWTIQSATSGISEAFQLSPALGLRPGTYNLQAPIFFPVGGVLNCQMQAHSSGTTGAVVLNMIPTNQIALDIERDQFSVVGCIVSSQGTGVAGSVGIKVAGAGSGIANASANTGHFKDITVTDSAGAGAGFYIGMLLAGDGGSVDLDNIQVNGSVTDGIQSLGAQGYWKAVISEANGGNGFVVGPCANTPVCGWPSFMSGISSFNNGGSGLFANNSGVNISGIPSFFNNDKSGEIHFAGTPFVGGFISDTWIQFAGQSLSFGQNATAPSILIDSTVGGVTFNNINIFGSNGDCIETLNSNNIFSNSVVSTCGQTSTVGFTFAISSSVGGNNIYSANNIQGTSIFAGQNNQFINNFISAGSSSIPTIDVTSTGSALVDNNHIFNGSGNALQCDSGGVLYDGVNEISGTVSNSCISGGTRATVMPLRSLTFAQLPGSAFPGLVWVSDGLQGTAPCTAGGGGALAVWQGSQWNCLPYTAGGGGGSGTVTSVTIAPVANQTTSSGSPITASGTITVGLSSSLIAPGTVAITGGLTTNVTGSTQCLHVNSGGLVSGTGVDCGAGSSTIPHTTNVIKGDGLGNGADTRVGITSPATAATFNFPIDNAVITFQGTDTYLGRTTTDTLTNKTYDTGGAGNVFKIATHPITAISGNSATLASASGTYNSGDGVKIDPNGNLVDTGSPASGGVTVASQLGDLNVIRTTSLQLTIGSTCALSTPCNVRFGYQVYAITGSATATLSGGTNSGLVYGFVNGAGNLIIGYPSSGMVLGCSAGCTATSGITSFPANSIPLFTWSAAANAWDLTGYTDKRSFQSAAQNLVASSGITLAPTAPSTTIGIDFAVVAQLISTGVKPTITGCGTVVTQTGGDAAGTFVSNATSCTATLTFSRSAATGWYCGANDLTTTADTVKEISTNATTAVLSGTTVSGDLINFACQAY